MIATAICVALLSRGSAPQANPGKYLSAMFARYYAAKTLVGTITLTQGVGSESGVVETMLQYERPAKIYVGQRLKTASGRTWLLTSDGKHFSYDKPDVTDHRGGRLVEAMKNKEGTLDIGGIYAAAAQSLGDRSVPLDVAIGRRQDLDFVRRQWATVNAGDEVDVDGVKYLKIFGSWREYGDAVVTGKYAILVSADGDLREYVVTEPIVVNGQETTVTSSWSVRLKVDATPDEKLFKVIL